MTTKEMANELATGHQRWRTARAKDGTLELILSDWEMGVACALHQCIDGSRMSNVMVKLDGACASATKWLLNDLLEKEDCGWVTGTT